MTLPPKQFDDDQQNHLKDPWMILGGDYKVVPLLEKRKLSNMIDSALQYKQLSTDSIQLSKSAKTTASITWSNRGRVSGILAACACFILFLALDNQQYSNLSKWWSQPSPDSHSIISLESVSQKNSYTSIDPFTEAADMNDFLLYDFLESL